MPNRLLRLLVLLVAVVLLAGCSQNLGPKTYNAEVKKNYEDTCIDGATEKLGDTAAKTYCECTYTAISAPAPAGISFDKFKSFETYLRDNVGPNGEINSREDLDKTDRYDDVLKLLDSCAPVGPTASGSSASTTVPTTTTAR